MNYKSTIFLLAGRTGGPIMPLLATFKGILEIEKLEKEKLKNTKNLKLQNLSNELENSLVNENLDKKSQFEAVIIGVKNGFEEKLAIRENLKLEFLPEAKLELLSFRPKFGKLTEWKQNLVQISEFLVGIWKFFGMVFLLLNSIFRSFWLICKYRPVAILSSGSFLAIPVLWVSWFWNLCNFKNILGRILIITHQQDPIPGLSSKLTFELGMLQTCVFDYSKRWQKFQNATIIPNPIDFTKFENTTKTIKNKELRDFLNPLAKNDQNHIEIGQTKFGYEFDKLEIIRQNRNINIPTKFKQEKEKSVYFTGQNTIQNSQNLPLEFDKLQNLEKELILGVKAQKLPLFLIFGGGSGSEFINNWVWQNLAELTQNFRILHLSGIHTEQKLKGIDNKDYNLKQIIEKNSSKFDEIPQNSQNQNSRFFYSKNSSTNKSKYCQIPNLLEDMPNVLKSADLVMCRAGLGSISELLYLSKSAFLVPLENSHQEKNAEIVSQFFGILEQKNSEQWLEIILRDYPQKFAKINYPNQDKIQQKLMEYYQQIYQLIDKRQ